MATDAPGPVEIGGNGHGRGHARCGFDAAHGDRTALDGEGGGGGRYKLGLLARVVGGCEAAGRGRESCLLSRVKRDRSTSSGLVDYGLLPRVAARLAPAPGALGAPAAARVAHHRDSRGRVVVGSIGDESVNLALCLALSVWSILGSWFIR